MRQAPDAEGVLTVSGKERFVPRGFCDCHHALRRLVISEGIRWIDHAAFSGCHNLEEVVLPDSLESIMDRAFYACPSLRTVRFGRRLILIGRAAFCGCSALTELRLPPMLYAIGVNAFQGCASLRSLDLPASVRRVANDAFRGCDSLAAVTIRSDITSSWHREACGATELEPERGIFADCDGLFLVHVASGVHRLPARCFAGCSALQGFSLPETCTDVPNDVFADASALTGVPRYSRNDRVLLNVFGGIEHYAVPRNLEEIADCAFAGASLKRIEFPAGGHLARIGRNAFTPYGGHWMIVPPTVRFYGGTDPSERVLLPMTCNSSAVNDALPRYNSENYGLLRACVDEARRISNAKPFDVAAFMSVLRRLESVRMTGAPTVRLEAFLDQIPDLSQLQSGESFFTVSEEHFAAYLEAILAPVSNLRRKRGLVDLAFKVLSDGRGESKEGRRRKIALVRRLMPFGGIDTDRERVAGRYVWPLLSEAGTAVRFKFPEQAFKRWTKLAAQSPVDEEDVAFEDEDQKNAVRADAAPLFMLRYELLAQRPTERMVRALIAAKAFCCLYELSRESPGVSFTPSILAWACECLAPKKAAVLVNRIAACGDQDLLQAKPSSRFGYLWHALCRMERLAGDGPWRNALTDALIMAGCDPDADCFCGLTFNEIARGDG